MIYLLHIGKTGGTFVRSIVERTQPDGLVICDHTATLRSTAADDPERRVAFTFRDPVDRFISGFNSRLRSGRPQYSSKWSAREAAAFSVFRTANSLAEGLVSNDEFTLSAAQFAIDAISHLRRGYVFHLHKPERLNREHRLGRVAACIDVADMDQFGPQFFARLGINVTAQDLQMGVRHAATGRQSTELSDLGRQALLDHLAPDYALYEKCQLLQQATL